MINAKTGVYTLNGEEYKFNFATSIPASMKVNFVEAVTKALIDNENNNYNFVIRDLMFDFYIIVAMTDVDVSGIADGGNVDVIEEFVNETNIVGIVKANADKGFIQALSDAVDVNLEYRTGVKIDHVSKALGSLLNTIENKIPEFDMDEIMNASEIFSQISGELSAEKLLEAYANSDVFKKYVLDNREKIAATPPFTSK